jgi:hypothetical protein
MVQIHRALRDPGLRGPKSIRAGFRRVCREYEYRVRTAMQSIEDGDDLEWNFNAYVIMCASRVFGQSAVQTLIDLIELNDPVLAAFARAFPREEHGALIDRFLENAPR